jgi:hypothetical protein
VHGAVSAVVRKALAYAPENRYQTAAELRDALEKAMVEAKVPTTTTDVAAFTAKHLAERTDRRRQAIELALQAAAERRRVNELLQPANEDSANGLTPPPSQGGIRIMTPAPPPLSSHAVLAAQEATRAEVPGRRASILSDQPPSPTSRSSATLGMASLESSASEEVPFKSRRPMTFVALAGAAIAAAVLGTVLARQQPHAVAPAAAAAAPPPVPEPAPALSPAPAPPQTATVAQSDSLSIPVVAASALPRSSAHAPGPATTPSTPANASPPASPSPPANASPPSAPPAPAATPAKPKPKTQTVDDGF